MTKANVSTTYNDHYHKLKEVGELKPEEEIKYIDKLREQVKRHKYNSYSNPTMTLGELKTELDELQVYEGLHPAHRHSVANMRRDVIKLSKENEE